MLIRGDAREIPLRSDSVQCVVTSPPYWGLRDYGTARWEGGAPECDHRKPHDMSTSGLEGGKTTTLHNHYHREFCPCGARRVDSQLGLESSPEEYVASMVGVMREVWRILRHDGTCWIVLGDSYAGSWKNQGRKNERGTQRPINGPMMQSFDGHPTEGGIVPDGLKPKDLVGIPWRTAFALQADGWYLRSDIIWAKPNPMPESVTDRCTKSHEYVFMLSKSATYYYDADAIREPTAPQPIKMPDGWATHKGSHGRFHRDGRENGRNNNGFIDSRNRRSVWEVATAPYSGAHFATFPPKLIEPMILAGSRPGDIVFDPFCGTGTTQLVAKALGRRGIGCDLKYQDLAAERICGPLFASVVNS